MFSESTQRAHWLFSSEKDLELIRKSVNKSYINNYRQTKADLPDSDFLSYNEERTLIQYYEGHLHQLCGDFQPSLPKNVTTAALHFYKRFYLVKSAMDYNPKYMAMTSIYLACKTEEFNLTVREIVGNINWPDIAPEKITEILIHFEMPLIEAIKFHLVIHDSFKSADAYICHLQEFTELDADTKREEIDKFLSKTLVTDVPLCFTPQQIAIAAIIDAFRREKDKLDPYILNTLLGNSDKEKIQSFAGTMKNIRKIAREKNVKQKVSANSLTELETKLEQCRNEDNNPFSAEYVKLMKADLYDDDEEM